MVQRVVQLFGFVFLLIGVLGFVPAVGGGMTMDADMATAPRLLGLFAVNTLHNVVHLLFGVWALAGARSVAGAVQFAKIGGGIYVVLALLGLVIPTTFGLIPIGGNDVLLHGVIGVVLLTVALQTTKT